MNDKCLFVSDLHGKINRYQKLFNLIEKEKPFAVFMGGDLLPSSVLHSFRAGENKSDFVTDFLVKNFTRLKNSMGEDYPLTFIIMGNDDPRIAEQIFLEFDQKGLWNYIQGKIVDLGSKYKVMGYSYVPPTPFLLKDWEKYDVVRDQVKPGCINPSEGFKTFNAENENLSETIQEDLNSLTFSSPMDNMICLFHSPPYKTMLDRAALDDVKTPQGNIDVHVGSLAIKNFIQNRQPYLCLHGHIHESSRITGNWKDKINRTSLISAAYEGPELAVISFHLADLGSAKRTII